MWIAAKYQRYCSRLIGCYCSLGRAHIPVLFLKKYYNPTLASSTAWRCGRTVWERITVNELQSLWQSIRRQRIISPTLGMQVIYFGRASHLTPDAPLKVFVLVRTGHFARRPTHEPHRCECGKVLWDSISRYINQELSNLLYNASGQTVSCRRLSSTPILWSKGWSSSSNAVPPYDENTSLLRPGGETSPVVVSGLCCPNAKSVLLSRLCQFRLVFKGNNATYAAESIK